MKNYREFSKDAIDALVRQLGSEKGVTQPLWAIATFIGDKVVYIQKVQQGLSFLPMKKIRRLIHFRPKVLQEMTRNYFIEEDQLNSVPKGGCTLYDYLFGSVFAENQVGSNPVLAKAILDFSGMGLAAAAIIEKRGTIVEYGGVTLMRKETLSEHEGKSVLRGFGLVGLTSTQRVKELFRKYPQVPTDLEDLHASVVGDCRK